MGWVEEEGEQGETLEASSWKAFRKDSLCAVVWDASAGKSAGKGDTRGCFRIWEAFSRVKFKE